MRIERILLKGRFIFTSTQPAPGSKPLEDHRNSYRDIQVKADKLTNRLNKRGLSKIFCFLVKKEALQLEKLSDLSKWLRKAHAIVKSK